MTEITMNFTENTDEIFERFLFQKKAQSIHCNGSDDDIENYESRMLGKFRRNNIYTEYNTYGLEWTDDEYIFYINGVETTRSSFGNGVSQIPQDVFLTVELPYTITHEKDFTSEFVIDYLRIYQKP